MTTTPDLPAPPGATADDWLDLTDIDGDMARALTWARYDTDKIGVAVDGWQTAGGDVTRAVSLYDTEKELTAADARRLAAALLNAADELDGLR
jgi:hypothetical protein